MGVGGKRNRNWRDQDEQSWCKEDPRKHKREDQDEPNCDEGTDMLTNVSCCEADLEGQGLAGEGGPACAQAQG